VSKYKCLACGIEFEAPVKVREVRHQKYGGCTWGIGVKISRRTKRPPDVLQVHDMGEVNGVKLTYVNGNLFATPAKHR